MSDRLYLSCWVRGFNESNMLRRYTKLLENFPFSKLSPRPPTLRVYAAEYAEPPAVEKTFENEFSPADVLSAAREFAKGDCACDLDVAWDLWQHDSEWKLSPAGVTISCLGPEFQSEFDDNLRIDFGLDSKFLPLPGVENSLRMQQSNLKSLLHLVKEIENNLPLSRRNLWSESGANFAELLAKAVENYSVN
jgi:hypothetical protein